MKKIIKISSIFLVFVLTNNLNAQEKITKESVQEFTNKVFKEYQTAVAVEMKIANEKVFIRVQTKDGEKKENFLLVTSKYNFHNQNFEKVEIIKMNFLSVLGNYIKKYYNDKRKLESEKN
ncbi:hypothetical protein [Psychroserpens sp. S379A]|uniref:hypothetical protein n=1 Tax=Psychroserpens sp. S379A TaxID=3415137 RepID=UPI003C7BC8A2